MNSTEFILNLTIWILTGAGIFFGGRAVFRKRRQRQDRRP